MSKGIQFLYDEYRKDPSKIEKLLSEKIEISEKLDGSRFLVQNNEGKLSFFKRKDVPITKIDRTLSQYYEKAIFHFENLPDEKISQFPDGWRFGMEYFPNLHPVTIVYDKLPLNNLVLTDIQVKDPRDKTIDIISDKNTLKKWASILEVESPPIIFEGVLSDSQKRRVLDFLNTPYGDLSKRFKTESFTSYVIGLLNSDLKASFLHNDLSKDIDGLIFKFNGKEAFRVTNPDIIDKKIQKREEKPSDIYNLTLVFLHEFLSSVDFKKIKLKEATFEERYIEFIEQVFNRFLLSSTYAVNFKNGVDFQLPKFLTRAESSVNFNFVKDPNTLDALKDSNTNRELFKILLASMRSHKRKPSGYFTKELIFHHNNLVDKIADYINDSLKESEFCSFKEFKSIYLRESEWQEEFGKESRIDEFEQIGNYDDAINATVLSESVEVEQPQIVRLEQPYNKIAEILHRMHIADDENVPTHRKTKCCIMRGKFQPFHNGHDTIIRDAEDESNLKVFLVVTNKRLSKNLPKSLQTKILDEIVLTNSSIKGYAFSDGRSMKEILRDLPKNIEASAFAGSEDDCDDVNNQLGKSFPTFPMTKHISTKAVIKKIQDEDFEGYKQLVPSALYNYFYKIKNELVK